MIKNHYRLSQNKCCGPPGDFLIQQIHSNHQQQAPKTNQEVISAFSQINFTPQQDVGLFQELKASRVCWCFSFRPIVELNLTLYGQRLSTATTRNSCCLNLCNGQLLVLALNNVILGRIKKSCNSYLSPFVLTIQNEQQNHIFKIKMQCCQCANLLPRVLNCFSSLRYDIYDNKENLVGKITNVNRGVVNSIFSLQDDFQVQFTKVEKEKQKILLLNAVVFINQLRHQLL